MDKVLSFFRNKWTKLGFSVLSIGYGIFMVWMAWLTFSFYIIPTNPAALFVLYLFINVIFGVAMIYTRKQIITQIVALFLHPCIMVTLIFAFGNWYLILPLFVVSTVVFFAAGSSETLKIVLGTIYLILFVLAILGYMTLQQFSIKIIDEFFNVNTETELRSPDYSYSTEGSYRLVKYIDEESKENRTVNYYIENALEDIELPFVKCEKIFGAAWVLTSRYEKTVEVKWMSDTKLLIDNKLKDVSVISEADENEEDDFSGETVIFTSPPPVTKAETTPIIY